MGPRTRTLALVLAALAPAAAGCGGGGSGTTTAPASVAPPISTPTAPRTASTAASTAEGKVDLPKPYSDVATDVQRRLDALGRKVPSASAFGTAAFGTACRALGRDVGGISSTLRAAQPPVPVRAQHAAVLRRLGSVQADFAALADASDARDLNAGSGALNGISTALAGVRSDIRRIRTTVK